jgi:glycosyltransferase involved in cell wall biosynthesis
LLQELIDDKQRVFRVIEARGPHSVASSLADRDATAARYLELARRPERAPARGPRQLRLVSVVIPYYRLDRYIEESLRCVLEQTYPRLEVVIVNDGSFRAQDALVLELAQRHRVRLFTQPNSGLGAARNAGIKQSRGHYVFPLDADNVAEPEFVERCVDVLEADESLAYATCWLQYTDERGTPLEGPGGGYQPLGNWSRMMQETNTGGDAAAVIRRRVFERGFWYSQDLASFEDWQFYRELRSAGLYGHVIPERLLRYRIREGSMLREIGLPMVSHLKAEMNAHLAERGIEWESSNA